MAPRRLRSGRDRVRFRLGQPKETLLLVDLGVQDIAELIVAYFSIHVRERDRGVAPQFRRLGDLSPQSFRALLQ